MQNILKKMNFFYAPPEDSTSMEQLMLQELLVFQDKDQELKIFLQKY